MKKLLCIVGPTASGKTQLGIDLAKEFNGEIISCDSRLIYRKMDIGTAKPDVGFQEKIEIHQSIFDLFSEFKPVLIDGISHFGFDLINPDETFSVSQFQQFAIQIIKQIQKRNHLPILVGGTGLWVSSVVDHLQIPEVKRDEKLRNEMELKHLADLLFELKTLDPKTFEVIDQKNKRRVIRALEVCKLTGKPFSQFQTKGKPLFDILQIGLNPEKEILDKRIESRIDEMVAKGLVNEVRNLVKEYGTEQESFSAIGYKEIIQFLENKMTLQQAIEDINKNTRDYAKRQRTWFKRDGRIVWVENIKQAKDVILPWFSN